MSVLPDGESRNVALAGQQYIGPYRLLHIVKTGQTSQVWAAMNDKSQFRCALKIILEEFRKDREHVAYMKNEFLVGKGLDHERVIHIFEQGVSQKIPYLVMEFFPYPNMKDIIQRVLDQVGFMLPTIIERAAEGLAYFNEQGWVHRDVKPDNFLVNLEGEVKLIDFALAKKPAGGLAKMFARKSKIQGTRSYMSPEQIRGRPLDVRSDVYSFGCTIFHLLAGQLPFTGVSSNELLNKHLTTPAPSVQASNRNITPEFSQLLQSMMSKRPESRPKDMNDFLRNFRAIKLYKTPPTPPLPAGDKENAA
jgi:serine/threonine protein kinase